MPRRKSQPTELIETPRMRVPAFDDFPLWSGRKPSENDAMFLERALDEFRNRLGDDRLGDLLRAYIERNGL